MPEAGRDGAQGHGDGRCGSGLKRYRAAEQALAKASGIAETNGSIAAQTPCKVIAVIRGAGLHHSAYWMRRNAVRR
jgi:hypothetical protein